MPGSKIFKELTPDEIRKVVSNLYGSSTEITQCSLLKGGMFNTTYHIHTDNGDAGIVLRVAPVNQHLLFDFERSMMSAEPLFCELLHAHHIPTSRVIRHDPSQKIIEREFIVYEFLPSVPMNDSSVPADARPALYRRVGELTAKMHEIKEIGFGWKRPGSSNEIYAEWGAFLKRFAREIAERSSNHGVFSDGELQRFLDVFANPSPFNKTRESRMVHTDLWEGNVLVSESNGMWQVDALIDVDRVIFGDRSLEFATEWMINDSFIDGYGCKPDSSPDGVFRRNAYNLLVLFFVTYVWLVQYDDHEAYARDKQRSLNILEHMVCC